jgi:hypothetical protein
MTLQALPHFHLKILPRFTSSKQRRYIRLQRGCFNQEGYSFLNICHVPDSAGKPGRSDDREKEQKVAQRLSQIGISAMG